MNTLDLIELAVLDALGMLEKDEAQAFDAAFRAAPPAVQQRVRTEQERLANLEALLPNVSPDAGVRDRVLVAVREAILAQAVAKASEEEDDAEPLTFRKSRGVHQAWRVGAVASAAAAIAFGVAFGHSTLRYIDLEERFQGNIALDGAIGAYGTESMDIFFNKDLLQDVEFTPVDRDSAVQVVLEYIDEKNVGFLRCGALPVSDTVEYALVALDANNQLDRTFKQFASSGQLTSQQLDDLVLENGMRLALVSVDVLTGSRQIMATAIVTL